MCVQGPEECDMKAILLFAAFFKVGLFGFGGGMAMLPLIYQSVQQFGFMSQEKFSDLLAISQVTPGPIAVNAATYVGFEFSGIGGAAAATAGVVLPAFIIMLIVSRMLERFKSNRIVQGAFAGIRPVTIGLILSAVVFVSEGVLVRGPLINSRILEAGIGYFDLVAIGIMIATVILMLVLKMRPVYVMLIMAAAGAVMGGTGLMG